MVGVNEDLDKEPLQSHLNQSDTKDMKNQLLVMITLLSSCWSDSFAKGPDFSVFEVRRQLALSNEEKTEKDYYIYAGSEEGVREGVVYNVVRKVPLYDGLQSRSLGDVTIKVAQVKVIYAEKNVSIARFHKEISRAHIPVLKDNYILLGDLIDLSSGKSAAGESNSQSEKVAQNQVQMVINSIDITSAESNP